MPDITERLRLNSTDWVFGNTATTALKEIIQLRAENATLREQNRALVELCDEARAHVVATAVLTNCANYLTVFDRKLAAVKEKP